MRWGVEKDGMEDFISVPGSNYRKVMMLLSLPDEKKVFMSLLHRTVGRCSKQAVSWDGMSRQNSARETMEGFFPGAGIGDSWQWWRFSHPIRGSGGVILCFKMRLFPLAQTFCSLLEMAASIVK